MLTVTSIAPYVIAIRVVKKKRHYNLIILRTRDVLLLASLK